MYRLPQLIDYYLISKNRACSSYKTKYPCKNVDYYTGLRKDLEYIGVKVVNHNINIQDFDKWLNDFPEMVQFYSRLGDVRIEKCLEHYLTYKYLNLSKNDVYIDIASASSPWAEFLNKKGIKSYSLDLVHPQGINGIKIGADASNTRLKDGFATAMSLQCAYECFAGDSDIGFVKEAARILGDNGRYAIIPLYLDNEHIIQTSPWCDFRKIKLDEGARKVWRSDHYKVVFSRHYNPKSFMERIWSNIPPGMEGKIIFFQNIPELLEHYRDQFIYPFFMFYCEKISKSGATLI